MTQDAFAALSGRLDGFWYSQTVHVAACLGLADHLGEDPITTPDLAQRVGVRVDPLRRFLRALAAIELCAFAGDDNWVHTPQSRLLRDDSPTQLRARAISLGALAWESWGRLQTALETGKPTFDTVHGVSFFEHLAANPELAKTFGRTMTSFTRLTAEAVAAAVDLSHRRRVADLGGGHGMMAGVLLRSFPDLQVTILDRPEVIAQAAPAVDAPERARLRLQAGDLFEPSSIPAAEVHVLSWILHDWDDERCHAILAGSRRQLEPGGELLIVEMLTGIDEPAFARFFDLEMLIQTGGRERTREQFTALLDAAGFELAEIRRTDAPHSVLIARPR
jgi:ubiquinone/menaquinone biosynthesis C-methylase UbiE